MRARLHEAIFIDDDAAADATLSVNGMLIDKVSVTSDASFVLKGQLPETETGKTLRIQVSTSRAINPYAIDARIRDERFLGVCVESVAFVDAAEYREHELGRGKESVSDSSEDVAANLSYVSPGETAQSSQPNSASSKWQKLNRTKGIVTASVQSKLSRMRRRGLAKFVRAGDKANSERQWEAAERAYSNALKIDPALVAIWVQLGHALKEQGKLQKAADAYRKAAAAAPGQSEPLLHLGHVPKRLGDQAKAAETFGEVLKIDASIGEAEAELRLLGAADALPSPSSATLSVSDIIRKGDRANLGRRWEDAVQFYREALVRDPSLPHIWVQLGHMLKESGDLLAAEDAYIQSLGIDPGNADTHLQMGHLLKLRGDVSGAKAAYLRALELDKALQDAQKELSVL